MYLYDSKMQYLNTIDSQNRKGPYLGGPFITGIPELRYEGLIDYKLPVIPPKNNLNDTILIYFGVAILIIIII